jgi:hypothetical protein
VVEAGDELDLALEAPPLARRGLVAAQQDLERHGALGGLLEGAEDDALAAAVQLALDAVARNQRLPRRALSPVQGGAQLGEERELAAGRGEARAARGARSQVVRAALARARRALDPLVAPALGHERRL